MGRYLEEIAVPVANMLKGGDVLFLRGDLGSGKTTLARYIIRHLLSDVSLKVTSPTFCLIQEYHSRAMAIYHCDFYRIAKDQVKTIYLESYISPRSILIIEWPEILQDSIEPTIEVFLQDRKASLSIDRSLFSLTPTE